MYPDRDTIPQLLPAPDVLLRLLTEKSKYTTKHLMSGPSGKYNRGHKLLGRLRASVHFTPNSIRVLMFPSTSSRETSGLSGK